MCLEKVQATTSMQHQCQAYTKKRTIYNCLLIYHEKQVMSKQINENRKNTRELFQIINRLTGNKAKGPMPPGKTAEELTEDLATFFLEKIIKYQKNSKQYQHIDQH